MCNRYKRYAILRLYAQSLDVTEVWCTHHDLELLELGRRPEIIAFEDDSRAKYRALAQDDLNEGTLPYASKAKDKRFILRLPSLPRRPTTGGLFR